MKLIERGRSALTGRDTMERLAVLKRFPVFFGCVDSRPEDDLFADMNWDIDRETGLIQLSKLIPLEVLYQAQHAEGWGPTWEKYYRSFAAFILAQNPRRALEIGGGQGRLAELVTAGSPGSLWTIVEPNPACPGSKNIKLISAFFDERFEWKEPLDAVVFSQVLEHAYDPQAFLGRIAALLPPGGKLIFAYPNLEGWLRLKQINALNFEHATFLTDAHVDYLLGKAGFRITEKTPYLEHSFFYVAEKTTEASEIRLPPDKYAEYKRLFLEFVGHYELTVKELNARLAALDGPVYLFGAHIFSQYLLSFGLAREKIRSILDNSAAKQGKRLYGTEYSVQAPEILRGQDRPVVILKAGFYNEEIKKDILENINPGTVFWE